MNRVNIVGLACALGAGLAWGLVFVAPVMLPGYPAIMLSIGRYLAFGLIALLLAWPARTELARLSRADWLEATRLSLIGNLLYYACLAGAIQLAEVPLPTLVIGTLPVVIAIVSNRARPELPWSQLLPSLTLMLIGIALVHHSQALPSEQTVPGVALAVAAVACWTWYPIRNARWMQTHPHTTPATWATAQGLTTLPLALAGWVMAGMHHYLSANGSAPASNPTITGSADGFAFPLGPDPVRFVALMLVIGLLSSWLGTRLWNQASRLLPTALVGQLIVFETLAALAYAHLWRGQWPDARSALGMALLVMGVILGVRAFSRPMR